MTFMGQVKNWLHTACDATGLDQRHDAKLLSELFNKSKGTLNEEEIREHYRELRPSLLP